MALLSSELLASFEAGVEKKLFSSCCLVDTRVRNVKRAAWKRKNEEGVGRGGAEGLLLRRDPIFVL